MRVFPLFLVIAFIFTTPGVLAIGQGNNINYTGSSQLEAFTNTPQVAEFLHVDQAYQLTPELIDDSALFLLWNIANDYYLYRHSLKVFIDGSNITQSVDIPLGKTKKDEFFGDVEVYYHRLDFNLDNIPPGPHTLSVTYQGCADAGLCYPPTTKRFNIDLTNGLIESLTPPKAQPQASIITEPRTSLWLIVLLAIAGGLILNIMPCVLPVLSLKALAINHQEAAKTRRQSWFYTLGVILSFIAIASLLIILRSAGEAVGWGFQLQSPWFVAFLVYLFLVLGLGLSGYTELGASMMGSGQALTQGNNNRSAFFTGVLATVVASPCTAPFMGAATGFALSQSSAMALLIFTALGFGMALPFLLISYIPSCQRLLPKPGPWMVRFKELLAFPLYATALWLLWVIGRQVGIDGAIMVLAGGILIAFALWLWRGGKAAKALAVGAIIFAFSFLNNPLLSVNESSASSSHSGDYRPFSPALLNQLRNEQQAVFINFTADWCLTCLANEKTALSSDKVQHLFKDKNIALLIADWTTYNPEITAALAQYGRSGVPLYVFFAPGSEQPIILPQLLSSNIVYTKIIQALNTSEK